MPKSKNPMNHSQSPVTSSKARCMLAAMADHIERQSAACIADIRTQAGIKSNVQEGKEE